MRRRSTVGIATFMTSITTAFGTILRLQDETSEQRPWLDFRIFWTLNGWPQRSSQAMDSGFGQQLAPSIQIT